jgi:hypothetical protein
VLHWRKALSEASSGIKHVQSFCWVLVSGPSTGKIEGHNMVERMKIH